MRSLLLVVLLFCLAICGNAQFTFGVDRANGAGPTVTNVSGPDAGCITSSVGLTRGGGITQNSGGDFNSRGWDEADEAGAKADGDYLQFSLTFDEASNINSLEIRIDRSGTGPDNYLLEYSFDAFSTAGTTALEVLGVVSDAAITYLATTNPVNFTGTVTYRLYAWGASSGNGTLDIEELGGMLVADDGVRIEGDKMVPAPVSLLTIEVARRNNAAVMHWSTATETGNDYFVVERSADGRKFDVVGRLAGAGDANTRRDYN